MISNIVQMIFSSGNSMDLSIKSLKNDTLNIIINRFTISFKGYPHNVS